jgi:hypothetical protein
MYDVKNPFDFYHDGVTKTSYAAGVQDIPDDAAEIAVREGWAVEVKEEEKRAVKRKK